MNCTNCNAEVKEGKKFCPKCGGLMPTLPKKTHCAQCGKEIPEGKKFCAKCGTPIELPPPYAPPPPAAQPRHAPPLPPQTQPYVPPQSGVPQTAPAPPPPYAQPIPQRHPAPVGRAPAGAPKKFGGFIALAVVLAVGFFIAAGQFGWLPVGEPGSDKPTAGEETAADENEDFGNSMTPDLPIVEEPERAPEEAEPETEHRPEPDAPEQSAESFAADARAALSGYWYTDFDYDGWRVYVCVAFNKNGDVFYSDGLVNSEPSTYITGKYTITDGGVHLSGKNELFDGDGMITEKVERDYIYSLSGDTLTWGGKGQDTYTLHKAKPDWPIPIQLD